MSSASSLGRTQIQVEFDLSRNPDAAAQDVQAAINAAGGDLPKSLPAPPFYEKVNPADFQLISIAVTSSDLPMAKIDDYVENYITPQLPGLPGRAYGLPGTAEAGHPRPDQSGGRKRHGH
jgi:multidrug efflux pump subunit AcrB